MTPPAATAAGDSDPDVALALLVARGRAEMERTLHRPGGRLWRGLMRLVGAIALGALAAGVAILGVAVVLNLIFHVTPR